ncbi:hypothetical protein G2W53_022652 [Senna tora]|uniref:Uncharacterized protein n=1 Tax=Senna tora TaxID=362788 RepID=A0A834WKQ7_9FABA|nr:hypothetical protein G2W53_022652 [Senna tora]
MGLLSAIFCCAKTTKKLDQSSYAVEAGSLSQKPKEIHKSSAPIVASYFPINSQPSRL